MPIGVDVGGPGDDAQYRVARAVGGRAFGHGFKSGSSAKGSSIDSSWPLPLDRKTSPISAAPSITDRPTPAAVAIIIWIVSASPIVKRSQPSAPTTASSDTSAKIGRASCRERVCQYVVISVVAVSLKKKIT